jgi:signal transduction histidine kinase
MRCRCQKTALEYLEKIDEASRAIQKQIAFTADYQDLGMKEPEWHETGIIVSQLISQLDFGRVRITNGLHGLSVYAEPLFGKVLYNLMDNALRYGETLTMVSLSYRPEPGCIVITIGMTCRIPSIKSDL